MSAPFLPLTMTALDLQRQLQENQISSTQLVEQYLAQIDRYESKLNAFISIAPRDVLKEFAANLDEERANGRLRSLLHGIPIVLKDSFMTAPDQSMPTTAGAVALAKATAQGNSAVTQKLSDAGLIILGKTNMTEFGGMKMASTMMPGWSAYGGQTLSPYVGKIEENETILGHSAPGGSSTGSAVAVAAGFSPLAMGADTIGSITTPASRAALYALKPTVGAQDTTGMYCLTDFFDSPGPMARSVGDLVALTEILLDRKFDLGNDLGNAPWQDLSVGFVDPRIWKIDPEHCRQHSGTLDDMLERYEKTITKLKEKGCSVQYPVQVPEPQNLVVDGEFVIMPIAFWEFKNLTIPRFLEAFKDSPVRSLKDIVEFNEKNKNEAMPPPYTEQTDLLAALNNNDTEEHITYLRRELRALGKQMLDEVFDKERIGIIAGPADSGLVTIAAAAGYPIATVPLGTLKYNGRPFGLCLMARGGDEETLLRFMAAYESVAPPRPVPDLENVKF